LRERQRGKGVRGGKWGGGGGRGLLDALVMKEAERFAPAAVNRAVI
jgi:hypothetical protein